LQTGTIPTSLAVSEKVVSVEDQQIIQRVNQELFYLNKQKLKLTEEIKLLNREFEDLRESNRIFDQTNKIQREAELKDLESRKGRMLEELELEKRMVEGHEQKLAEEERSYLDIAEYYADLADELVWENAQNDTQRAEIKKNKSYVLLKRRMVDQDAEETLIVVKQTREQLVSAKLKAETMQADAAKFKLANAYINTELNYLKKELLEKKAILIAKHETLTQREAKLSEREMEIRDARQQLSRAQAELNI